MKLGFYAHYKQSTQGPCTQVQRLERSTPWLILTSDYKGFKMDLRQMFSKRKRHNPAVRVAWLFVYIFQVLYIFHFFVIKLLSCIGEDITIFLNMVFYLSQQRGHNDRDFLYCNKLNMYLLNKYQCCGSGYGSGALGPDMHVKDIQNTIEWIF